MNQGELEKEFADSFAEFGDQIFRFCIIKVSDPELAEDMTQEVFMRYWQYLRAGKLMTNTRSFLYTIANNLAKDWYKKKKPVSLEAKLEAGQSFADSTLGPSKQAEYQEVLDAIDGMEENDKTVLILTHVEGLDPKTIAEVLDETANTISVRLNRATKRLQKKLSI